MTKSLKKPLGFARLSEAGELTIPDEYRQAHRLSGDSTLVLMEVGDALVVAPYDDYLAEVTDRLEVAMKKSGLDIDDIISAATEARTEIVREQFGPEEAK